MKDTYIRIRVTTKEKNQAKRAARATKRSISELIRFLIVQFCEKDKVKEDGDDK